MEVDAFQDEGSYILTFVFALFIAIGEVAILKLCSILARYRVEIKILAICAAIITLSLFVPEPLGEIVAIPTILVILYKFNSNKRIFLMFALSLALNWLFLYILLAPIFMYLYYLAAKVFN